MRPILRVFGLMLVGMVEGGKKGPPEVPVPVPLPAPECVLSQPEPTASSCGAAAFWKAGMTLAPPSKFHAGFSYASGGLAQSLANVGYLTASGPTTSSCADT